jgi:hypothetical protein
MTPHEQAALDELTVRGAPMLARSPFALRARWGSAVVILRGEERRVTSRADFAGWLAANDLRSAAHECLARHVRPGNILAWVEIDTPDVAAARFVMLDLARALRPKTDSQCTKKRTSGVVLAARSP